MALDIEGGVGWKQCLPPSHASLHPTRRHPGWMLRTKAIKQHSFPRRAAESHFLQTCLSHPSALQQQRQPSVGWGFLDESRWLPLRSMAPADEDHFGFEQQTPVSCSPAYSFTKLLICLTFSSHCKRQPWNAADTCNLDGGNSSSLRQS